jgi:hypothetical protein
LSCWKRFSVRGSTPSLIVATDESGMSRPFGPPMWISVSCSDVSRLERCTCGMTL